ncbi:transcriptional activator, adenine-specific DNA methyltransferase domain protein [Clostridioides difficile DA00203]|nr:transcriptional activator, adenine-specific DNA methyltransferase domain protein [Clostridioides difficile DA00203]
MPHTSQPGGDCLANSSTLGRSPMRATIFSRASSGLRLCSRIGEMIN